MTPIEMLDAVEKAGGSLVLNAGQIKYLLPKAAVWLVPKLRQRREEIIALLEGKPALPTMPPGVRLVRWHPKQPPLVLEQYSVVIDVEKFISSTLAQLRARLEGKDFAAGNWTLRELIERLEQAGVEVAVDRPRTATMAQPSTEQFKFSEADDEQ
jgi:hypothetical protein